jgi:4a-hydroxytetrahydrobiopterin dehydratase
MELNQKKCIPCEDASIKPFSCEEVKSYMQEVDAWKLNDKCSMISKEFVFKDFFAAINFVDAVADIAEGEGHHPDIHIFYNKVRFDLSTHSIGGLSENDFIIGSKIDALFLRTTRS